MKHTHHKKNRRLHSTNAGRRRFSYITVSVFGFQLPLAKRKCAPTKPSVRSEQTLRLLRLKKAPAPSAVKRWGYGLVWGRKAVIAAGFQ